MDIQKLTTAVTLVDALEAALDNTLLADGQDIARFVSSFTGVEDGELRLILAKLAVYYSSIDADSYNTDLMCEALTEYNNL
tara:strand:+ start:399 stop:641 length:243 start_codon:yes stop_codon:yes gene_type:complete